MSRALEELKIINHKFCGALELFRHLEAEAGIDRVRLYASYNRFLVAKDAENFPEPETQEESRV